MTQRIGFVGVGRMGANMALRLKECGYTIAAVYDVNAAAAQSLAQELGCVAADQLKVVTALSDVIFTVVSDDKEMKKIFNGGLLSRAKGKLFINCATIYPVRPRLGRTKMRSQRRQFARSLHGFQYHPGAAGHTLPHVRRQT